MAESDQTSGRNLYAVLGLTPDATAAQIRAAHDKLVGEIASGARPAEEGPAIDEAFQTLNDPVRRLRYDARVAVPTPTRPTAAAGRRPSRRTAPISRGRRVLPGFGRLDPLLLGAIALVVLLAIVVLLLPLIRRSGRSPSSSPSAEVASSATAVTAAANPSSPLSGNPASGSGNAIPLAPTPPPLIGVPGTGAPSLLPLTPGAPGSLVAPPGAGAAVSGQPPFVTRLALGDMVQAVVAAAAVRNGPSTATLPAPAAPPAAAAPSAPSAAAPPAGVPITSVGALPPVAVPGGQAQPAPGQPATAAQPGGAPLAAGQPGSTVAAASAPGQVTSAAVAATPTPRPVPNRITVPTTPVVVAGNQAGSVRTGPSTTSSGSVPGPNRIAPATPPSR